MSLPFTLVLVLCLGIITVVVREVCKNGLREGKILELAKYKLKVGEERKGD